VKLQIENEDIELLSEKAFFWPRVSLLGLSDVHLGKAESFQSLGIPLPSAAHVEDLKNIEKLVKKTNPKKVIILGDWIHHRSGWTPELQEELKGFFARQTAVEWTLLIGNHERGSLQQLAQFPMKLQEESLEVGPFLLTHGHLETKSQKFQIQGHFHPVITLREGPLKMRLPCFVLQKKSLLLPSFGSLTGGHEFKTTAKDRVFAVTPSDVFEVQ